MDVISLQPVPNAEVAANSEGRKLIKAGQDFEGVLLNTLLQHLEETMGSVPGAAKDATADQYRSFSVQVLATGLAASGGLGLGRLVVENILKKQPLADIQQASKK